MQCTIRGIEDAKSILWPEAQFPGCSKWCGKTQRLTIPRFDLRRMFKLLVDGRLNEAMMSRLDCGKMLERFRNEYNRKQRPFRHSRILRPYCGGRGGENLIFSTSLIVSPPGPMEPETAVMASMTYSY